VTDKAITMDNLRLLCLVVYVCKETARRPRYKYSITAGWKFFSRFINSRLNAQHLLSYRLDSLPGALHKSGCQYLPSILRLRSRYTPRWRTVSTGCSVLVPTTMVLLDCDRLCSDEDEPNHMSSFGFRCIQLQSSWPAPISDIGDTVLQAQWYEPHLWRWSIKIRASVCHRRSSGVAEVVV